MNMTDWEIIKQDYVTSRIGYRKLAEKYNVDKGKVQRKGTAEKWPEERKRYLRSGTQDYGTAHQKLADNSDIASKIESLVLLGLDKIICAMKLVTPTDTSALRQLVSTLKDLEDIAGVKLGMDLDEWSVRMAALKKQTSGEEENETGVVLIPGIVSSP